MADLTLTEAIAKVQQRPHRTELEYGFAAEVILNAVASGDLIPRADAELAVSEAFMRAADIVRNTDVAAEWTSEGALRRAALRHAANVLELRAPADALAEVQRMRDAVAQSDHVVAEWAEASQTNYQRAKAAEAERDRLAAANAALEAKVAGLVEAVKPFDAVGGTLFSKNWNMSDIVFDGGPMRSDCLFFEDFLNLRAALATQEAGT